MLVLTMDNQDWAPTIITRSRAAAAAKGGPHEIRERQTSSSSEAIRMAKLATAEDIKRPKVLSRDAVATIQNYRRQNNLTQKQLDQQLSFPPNTINKLEARFISPTSTQLNTLNRVLKTGLTLE